MSLGIYIHIPFCRAKCGYCHFVSTPFYPETAERYEKAVVGEMKVFSGPLAAEEVDSIYFGGGTPSLVPAEQIAGILGECRRRFRISEDCEVSLEANPDTVSAGPAALLRDAGVNRISLGAQSFVDEELSLIGRLHSADMILQSLACLHANGLANISVDLMLGLPLQSAKSWRKSLAALARISVPHVSVYMLDLDEGSPLYSRIANGSLCLPEEDLVSDLYLETIDFLSSCGYLQYEISNFARSGHACRHNLKYWTRAPVLGFGLGSHSFDRNSRYANCTRMGDYLEAVESGLSPVTWREPVTATQALEETLFLGLRLTEGVDWGRLRSGDAGGHLAQYEGSLRELCARGLVEWKDPVVRLTASGMLLSNEIFQLFV